jgi:hypothetical protein
MVLLSGDGSVYGFKTNRRVPGGSIWWGQKYGASTNASAPAMDEPTSGRYTAQLIFCGVVMIGVMAGNIIFRQRRRRYAK